MNAFSTISSAYLVLYILGSMYIDLAHTGDEPCKCTGCDKGFINELYKWDTSYQFRFSIFILVFLSLDFINELYIMHLITHILGRQVVLKDTSVSTLERSHINVILWQRICSYGDIGCSQYFAHKPQCFTRHPNIKCVHILLLCI